MIQRTEPQRFSFHSQPGRSRIGTHPAAETAFAQPQAIKPITGSWFEFQHHSTVEGVDWNPACDRFTAAQWEAKIKEIAEAGLEYLVLMATAALLPCLLRNKNLSQVALGLRRSS